MALNLEAAYRKNRLAFIGTGAVIAGVGIAWLQLRKSSAPVILAAPAAGGTIAPATDPLAAFNAGSAAAGSGFDQGSALGQSALSLAGQVVDSQGGVAQTLAGSQAALGATLGQVLGTITTPTQGVSPAPAPTPMPGSPPTVTPPITTIPAPTPVTAPPPSTTTSSNHGAKPAGAIGYLTATGVPLFSVSGGVAHQTAVSANVGGWIGPAAHYSPNATLNRILTGGHAGSYVPAYRGTVSPT